MVLTLVPILKFAVEDKKFKWVDEMDSKHGTSWKLHSIKLAFIKSRRSGDLLALNRSQNRCIFFCWKMQLEMKWLFGFNSKMINIHIHIKGRINKMNHQAGLKENYLILTMVVMCFLASRWH